VFSFNGNKILTSSGGGMLASHDKALIDHARKLATQARENVPHYEHTEIGYNYRMSNIVAAVGLGQLEVLDARVARKRAIRRIYEEELAGVPGIRFMPVPEGQRPNGWLAVILIDQAEFGASPETVRLALEAENIEARPVWKPMHAQPVFLPDGAYGSRHQVRVVGGDGR
jgi:dTDP-4-amino-4,6-dideoxygalactose transaminase